MESLYVVDVTVVGYCKVSVTATSVDDARERAVACATPFHVMEDGWEYVPCEAISDDQVQFISPVM